jgi:hypothetical protein
MSGSVVCMIRGGEASRLLQEEAITYARREDLTLIFFHIIDLAWVAEENEALLEPARIEMAWLACFNLRLASRRARDAGVRVETAIRYGPIYKTVVTFLNEIGAQRLYIGSPRRQMLDYKERMMRVQAFKEQIAQATGVEVLVGPQDGEGVLPLEG